MEKKKETQYDQIYNFIKKYGSITPMQAFQYLHITKLATRISEMTKSGHYTVKKTPVNITHRDGTQTRYMKYTDIRKKRKVRL